MAEEPVGFHRRATSASLELSGPGQSVATRRGIPRGIAVGRVPCAHNEKGTSWGFSLILRKVANLEHFSSGLWVGFTATPPKSLISQDITFAADVPDSVVVGGEGVLWDGHDCLSVDWHTGRLHEGDEICVRLVSAKNKLSITVNGQPALHVPKVYMPAGKQIYPLVELCGCAEAVEMFPAEPISPKLPVSGRRSTRFSDTPPASPKLPVSARRGPRFADSPRTHPKDVSSVPCDLPQEDPRPIPQASTPPPHSTADFYPLRTRLDTSGSQRSPSSSPDRHPEHEPRSQVRSNSQSRGHSPPRRSVDRTAGLQPAATTRRGQEPSRGANPPPKPVRAAPSQQSAFGRSKPQRTSSPPCPPGVPSGPSQRPRQQGDQLRSQVRKADSPTKAPEEWAANDWKTQARVWASVEACLQNPQKHSQGYWNLCREFAATRSQRDRVEAQLQHAQREVSTTASESKRRDREVQKLKAMLSKNAQQLDEATAALEEMSKKTSEVVAAKTRAQKEARLLKEQMSSGENPRQNVLDRKISRAWDTAEQVANANENGTRTEAHLRQLEATFETALGEIRETLKRESRSSAGSGPKAAAAPKAVARTSVRTPQKQKPARTAQESAQPLKMQAQRTSQSSAAAALPPRGQQRDASRNRASSQRASSQSPPRAKPSRGAATVAHPKRGHHRALGVSASVESLGDQSTTCSSTGGGGTMETRMFLPPGGLPPGPPPGVDALHVGGSLLQPMQAPHFQNGVLPPGVVLQPGMGMPLPPGMQPVPHMQLPRGGAVLPPGGQAMFHLPEGGFHTAPPVWAWPGEMDMPATARGDSSPL